MIVIVYKMKIKLSYNIQCSKTCKFAYYKFTLIFSKIIFSSIDQLNNKAIYVQIQEPNNKF